MSKVNGRNLARRFLAPLLLVGAPLAWLGVAAAPPAGALTTFTVTNNADTLTAGTLRTAITSANAAADDAEIDVNAGLGTITLTSPLPSYSGGTGGAHALTLKGNGVTIAGSGSDVLTTSATGAFSIDAVTINGAGADGISGSGPITLTNSTISGAGYGLDVGSNTVSVINSTISGAVTDGIAIGTGALTVTNSTISGSGNEGISAGSGETITVTNSRITNSVNTGINLGDNATITVTGSTIDGGGYFAIDSGNGSTLSVINSTIANNGDVAVGTGNSSTENLVYATITGNSDGFAQIGAGTGNTLNAFGSVVTSPALGGVNCSVGSSSSTLSQGYSYSDDATCGFTQPTDKQSAANPSLGTLGANGGPSPTELPNVGSPLIDAIPAASCQDGLVPTFKTGSHGLAASITTDQRGVTRPQGPGCDIGAVEVVPPVVIPPSNFNGYRMAADDGGVFDFGINFGGSLANIHLNAPIIGIANSPGPNGYLLVAPDGGVFALGGAQFYGSLGGQTLASPIAGIAVVPSGRGYWLVSQNGHIYNFGVAPTLPAVQVPSGAQVVGIASTNTGLGAWVTDNRGDVYTAGDALFFGSLGGKRLNSPVVGIGAAATGQGYDLIAADGGVFAFNVGFFGSVPGVLKPGQVLNAPVVGIAETHSGKGYWAVAADGGVFAFGDAPFLGSVPGVLKPGQVLNGPVIGIQHLGAAPA